MPEKRWTVGFRDVITYDNDRCPHLCDDPSRNVCDYLSGKGKTVDCSFDVCPYQGIPELITYETPLQKAAPDLLAACKALVIAIDGDGEWSVYRDRMANAVEMIRAAIAKAEEGGE
jgi:hypothetical protein